MSNTHQTIPEHHVEDDEKLLHFLQKNSKALIGGLCAIVAALAGFGVYGNYNSSLANSAGAMLSQASSKEQLKEVVDNYPQSSVAPMALINLAAGQFRDAEYDDALASYTRFETSYLSHELFPEAQLGKAYCLEAKGDLEGAKTAFEAFATTYPDHIQQATASLSLARCYEQLEQWDLARTTYEGVMVDHAGSPWAEAASEGLEYANGFLK